MAGLSSLLRSVTHVGKRAKKNVHYLWRPRAAFWDVQTQALSPSSSFFGGRGAFASQLSPLKKQRFEMF
jgi:hypothetical protein